MQELWGRCMALDAQHTWERLKHPLPSPTATLALHFHVRLEVGGRDMCSGIYLLSSSARTWVQVPRPSPAPQTVILFLIPFFFPWFLLHKPDESFVRREILLFASFFKMLSLQFSQQTQEKCAGCFFFMPRASFGIK